MKTDELIRTLAADGATPRPALEKLLLAGGILGWLVAAMGFMMMLRPRPDIMAAAQSFNFQLKLAFTLLLASAAAGFVWRALRPGTTFGFWPVALIAAPLLLGAGIMHEMMVSPASTWMPGMIGRYHSVCLVSILTMAAPILAGLLYVSRAGAPERPALTGAVAGLLSGGLAAALYATHCVDDSPMFVALWYGLAITAVALIGAVLGSRLLRW